MNNKFLFIILSLVFILSAVTVHADDLFSEEYYRATDSTGELSEEQRDELEAICLDFVQRWHLDLALLALPHDKYENLTISELAMEYYEDCGFGYGRNHDGFMMVLYPDTKEIIIESIGDAKDSIPDYYLHHIEKTVIAYQEDYGVYGPMYATTKFLNDYMIAEAEKPDISANDKAAETSETSSSVDLILTPEPEEKPDSALDENGIPDSSLRQGKNGKYPAWYPLHPSTFPEYHDENASRVVDNADLLSPEEETVLDQRLTEIRRELNKDIVVFTDVSDYGLDEMVYAADFYDFNGYGCGDDYEGVVIFVNMDPNDRGWWVVCSGPETRALYTEDVANDIDDMLYEYMRAGTYYEGLSDWVENFRSLYVTGSPYTRDWVLLINDPSFVRENNADVPRIVDDAKLLTEDEISALKDKAAQISQKYNLDVVVHTARSEGNLDLSRYSELYYYYNGYGYGNNYDGIILTVFKRPNHSADTQLYASGSGTKRLTEVNSERLRDRCEDVLDDQLYYSAIDQWLDQTDHMLKTGRAPKAPSDWTFTLVIELLAGIVIGGISLARAKARMATPAIKEDADNYITPGSLKIRKVSDIHTGTTSTQTYSPIREDDHSPRGGSSGKSSYSSSFSGSSGRTHSGSGRRF